MRRTTPRAPSRGRSFTRREVFRVAGAGAAGALAAAAFRCRAAPAGGRARDARTDVLVVGAGLAGLVAARTLRRAGRSVVVLDARDRAGGRVKEGRIAGRSVDLGGMWAGPRQERLLALLAEYGIATVPQYLRGRSITELAGKRYVGNGESLPLGAADERELRRVSAAIDALAGELPLEAPWTAPRAAEWDAVTLGEWARRETRSPAVRGLVALFARGLLAAEADEISLLFFLFSVRSGGSLDEVWGMEDGAQAYLVSGGMHRLPARLAGELGGSLRLSSAATAVVQDASGVAVATASGETHRAARAIVATPLPLSARLLYEPALPAARDALAQRSPMGAVVKYWMAYREPFWRRGGWNGMVSSDRPPTGEVYDASPPDGGVGLLVGFVEARLARTWSARPAAERRRVLASRLAEFFGADALRPIDYVDDDWPADPWSRGCFGATMGPGVLTTVGSELRRPFGRVHWAGAETSAAWSGYVEGAIRSGERAAGEVLPLLR